MGQAGPFAADAEPAVRTIAVIPAATMLTTKGTVMNRLRLMYSTFRSRPARVISPCCAELARYVSDLKARSALRYGGVLVFRGGST
jgi:hypothetical protein